MRTFDLDRHWATVSARAPLTHERSAGALTAVERDWPDGRSAAEDQHAHPVAAPAHEDLGSDGLSIGRLEFDNETAAPVLHQRIAGGLRAGAARSYRFARGFDPSAAVWLSLGFVAGMAAWHAVGFWGFVSATVLNDPDRSPAVASRSAPLQPSVNFKSIITTGSITPATAATFSPQPAACVALVADRTTGVTNAVPCRADQQPLRDAGRRKRSDRMAGIEARLQNAGSWATDTQTNVAAQSRDADRGTLTEQDFNLTVVSD